METEENQKEKRHNAKEFLLRYGANDHTASLLIGLINPDATLSSQQAFFLHEGLQAFLESENYGLRANWTFYFSAAAFINSCH